MPVFRTVIFSAYEVGCAMRLSVTLLVLLSALTIASSPVAAQQIAAVRAQGTCQEFRVTVIGNELGDGCWDVKLDIPGQIKDGDKWMSTFFYIGRAICSPKNSTVMDIRLLSTEDVVKGKAKIRQDSRIAEMPFTIVQSCPEPALPLNGFWALFAAFAIIIIFGWGLVWWWKQGKHT